jgi:intracellular sulfur oxidation DsrE/DsrF family protein
MSHKTLSEAAAEVLNKSRADAYSQPAAKLSGDGASGAEVDVGGSTLEDPEGNEVGTKTADDVKQAAKPGVASDGADPAEAPKKLVAPAASAQGRPLVTPETMISGAKELMHPTTEEVELTAEELAEAKADKVAKMKEKMKAKSVKEDVDAILAGETFSDEFKTKLTTIFESAVIAKAVLVVEEMETDILAAAEEAVEDIKKELDEQVDAYLTTMVEEWKAENAVAIESGLKSEIVEDFLSGLKTLFEENYIDLPAEKVNVVEALSAEVAELTEKLNNSMNSNVDLTKKINEATKQKVTTAVCEGLTATQAEKVKTLAEGVEFTTEGEYTEKLKMIRKSYFSQVNEGKTTPVSQVALVESTEAAIEQPAAVAAVDPMVAAYARAIK